MDSVHTVYVSIHEGKMAAIEKVSDPLVIYQVLSWVANRHREKTSVTYRELIQREVSFPTIQKKEPQNWIYSPFRSPFSFSICDGGKKRGICHAPCHQLVEYPK